MQYKCLKGLLLHTHLPRTYKSTGHLVENHFLICQYQINRELQSSYLLYFSFPLYSHIQVDTSIKHPKNYSRESHMVILLGLLPCADFIHIPHNYFMMTSSNVNIIRVTGPLWGESIDHRLIPLTKASDTELWCFLWSVPEQMVVQTIETPVTWAAIALTVTSL